MQALSVVTICYMERISNLFHSQVKPLWDRYWFQIELITFCVFFIVMRFFVSDAPLSGEVVLMNLVVMLVIAVPVTFVIHLTAVFALSMLSILYSGSSDRGVRNLILVCLFLLLLGLILHSPFQDAGYVFPE